MSINDYADSVELAALQALFKTGALKTCQLHSDVTINVGDPDAERHAYATATNTLKRDGTMFMREDVMDAIKDALGMAADGECPVCGG